MWASIVQGGATAPIGGPDPGLVGEGSAATDLAATCPYAGSKSRIGAVNMHTVQIVVACSPPFGSPGSATPNK